MPYVAISRMQRAVGRIMADHGETMTLHRMSDNAELSVKGKRLMKSRSGGQEIEGSFSDAALYFRIGTAELAAAGWGDPQIGDKIAASGHFYEIVHVDTRLEAGVVIMHNLWVAG